MAYRYEIIILDRALCRFTEAKETADSFVEAMSRIFLSDTRLCPRILNIYCRKPVSGDLQLMGRYDGLMAVSSGGEAHSHILSLSNGMDYYLTDDGFRRKL